MDASKYLMVLLQFGFVLLVSSSVIKRYQDSPLQVCPAGAVCSEIYSAPAFRLTSSFYAHVMCKCPGENTCPDKPNQQTLSTDSDRWYGLCEPVEDIPTCAPGQLSEQIVVGAPELGGRTYNKVLCRCEGEVMEQPSRGNWANSAARVNTYDFICGDESMMSKRGERWGNSRSRGRFYFYRK